MKFSSTSKCIEHNRPWKIVQDISDETETKWGAGCYKVVMETFFTLTIY